MDVFRIYSDRRYHDQVIEDEEFDTLQLNVFATGAQVFPKLPEFRLMANPDYPRGEVGDFEILYGTRPPVLSKRAVDELRDLLDENGQLFQAPSREGKFFFYNVTTVIDALDTSRSEIEYFTQSPKYPRPKRIHTVKRYEFFEAELKAATIFKVPQLWLELFVTDAFVQRVGESRLTGFDFHQVWPPPDPEIERRKFLEKRERKRMHKKP